MEEAKHTPTPWRTERWTSHALATVLVDDLSTITGKRIVAECDREEDAAFIAHACNSHEQLVTALKVAHSALLPANDDPTALGKAVRFITAALAAAEA